MKTHQTGTMKMLLSFRKGLWPFMGYLLIHGAVCMASAEVRQDAAVSHHCEGNDKIADVVMTIHHLQEGAEAGCPRCQATLAWLTSALVQPETADTTPPVAITQDDADAAPQADNNSPVRQLSDSLTDHRLTGHDGISDAEVIMWAEKGCAECQKRLPIINEHRCPTNAEVRQALPGTSAYRELKKGYEQGCPRCKTNYLLLLKRH